MYSCWARCRACTRVWPRSSREKQIPCNARDSRKAACFGRRALQDTGCARGHRAGLSEDRRYDGESRSLIALGMTPGARGRRVGGSEDPPLQLKGAEVGMVGAAGNAAVAAVDKHE